MADGNLVYMSELTDLRDAFLHAASPQMDEVTNRIVAQMAEQVAVRAYELAPKKTGELANSIYIEYGDREARVIAGAPYAAFVEFGTWSHNVLNPKPGTYTIRPKKPGGVLRFTGSDGRPVFTKKVEHPGVRAQPFLGPANAEVLDDFEAQIGNAAVLLLVDR